MYSILLNAIELLLEFCKNPKNNYCTNDTTDEITDPRVGVDAEKTEKPATNTTAYDTEKEVDDKTIATATLQLASDKTCKEADDNRINHNCLFLVI